MTPEDCIRKRVEIEGENFYIITGKDFCQATVPRENSRDSEKLRTIVDKVCDTITESLTSLSQADNIDS